jgi:hypothetical protein
LVNTERQTWLAITPRQAFEVSRLLDRAGNGVVAPGGDGALALLVDVFGTGSPNLCLELDREGEVIGHQLLDLARHEDADNGLGDLADGELLEGPSVLDPLRSGARLSARCKCTRSLPSDDACARCGHRLPGDAAV